MNYTHYLFAAFVFLLLVSLVVIYDRLRRARMEQQDAIAEKERRLFTLYQNLEDMMDSMEEYIDNATGDIRQERAALEAMMAKMESYSQNLNAALIMNTLPAVMPKEDTPATSQEDKPAPRRAGGRRGRAASKRDESKSGKVLRLQAEGFGPEQIAQELGLSRGEVTLILSMKNE